MPILRKMLQLLQIQSEVYVANVVSVGVTFGKSGGNFGNAKDGFCADYAIPDTPNPSPLPVVTGQGSNAIAQ